MAHLPTYPVQGQLWRPAKLRASVPALGCCAVCQPTNFGRVKKRPGADVSALCLDEADSRIYTGTRRGLVHVWGR